MDMLRGPGLVWALSSVPFQSRLRAGEMTIPLGWWRAPVRSKSPYIGKANTRVSRCPGTRQK